MSRCVLAVWVVLAVGALPVSLAEASVVPPAPVGLIPRSVWLYEPDPAALPSVHARLDEVLDHVSPVNRSRMVDTEVRIHVIPQDRNLPDLPPWANLRGALLPNPIDQAGYLERRSYEELRGLGPAYCVDGPLDIAVGEELLVALPSADRGYGSPAAGDLGKILVHEVGHGVECSLTDAQDAALERGYAAAVGRSPTDVVGDYPAYTVSTVREYFAEGVVAWFEAAQGATYRRSWLFAHDRVLHDVLADVFAVPEPVPLCDGQRATMVLHGGSGPVTGTPGDDVIVGSAGDDVVNGGGGNDVICGGDGDDTLRGGYGDDRIFGGPGDDHLAGGAGDDFMDGGAGADTLADASGKDHMVGGADNDDLDASDGHGGDVIDGGDGIDRCSGDADDPVISCNEPQPQPTTTTTLAATQPQDTPISTSATSRPQSIVSTTSSTTPSTTSTTMPSVGS